MPRCEIIYLYVVFHRCVVWSMLRQLLQMARTEDA